MKRSPLRSKPRPDVAALDKLCREVVLERDHGKCCRCNTPRDLEWAHVHTRRLHSMRWMLENSLALCHDCHRWWHDRPMAAAEWWAHTYPDRMKKLTRMQGTVTKPDLEAAKKALMRVRA
jgi:5-methylcytosine-specific restriction endonuclease McrA